MRLVLSVCVCVYYCFILLLLNVIRVLLHLCFTLAYLHVCVPETSIHTSVYLCM